METTETCTANVKISGNQLVSSNVCYTNRGILEIIVKNESQINEHLYYEVLNFYSERKIVAGSIEAGQIEKYCIKISEETHLVQAAYILMYGLSPTCSGFAYLHGVIDHSDHSSDQIAYHHIALEIALSNHIQKCARGH